MKNKRVWVLLGGLILIGLAFLLLSFRVAVGNTQAMKKVMTTDLGQRTPYPGQRNDKISLVLAGEGPLVSALQKALTEKMGKVGIGEIERVQELAPEYPNPVLVVKVGRPSLIWTPFFAMGRFSVHAGYASNGDISFMESVEKTLTYTASPDHSVLNMYAEYEVNDRSLGLISRVGYFRFLTDYLAQEIVAAFQDLYNG